MGFFSKLKNRFDNYRYGKIYIKGGIKSSAETALNNKGYRDWLTSHKSQLSDAGAILSYGSNLKPKRKFTRKGSSSGWLKQPFRYRRQWKRKYTANSGVPRSYRKSKRSWF